MKFSHKLALSLLSLSLFQFLPTTSTNSVAQASEVTSTYTACYFRNGASETWRWGLTPNDDWFEMSGTWENRRHTGTTYFKPGHASANAIVQSCRNSQSYYGESGTLIGVYAANSGVGKNYEIRVGNRNADGTEVNP